MERRNWNAPSSRQYFAGTKQERNHKATPWFAVRRTFCSSLLLLSSSLSAQGIESPLLAYPGRAKCSLIPNCIPCTHKDVHVAYHPLLPSFRATLPRNFYDPPPPLTPPHHGFAGNNSWKSGNTCSLFEILFV